MSLLAATQIPKPRDEQAFERASVVLWRCILNHPNADRNGRRGQKQDGVDLWGYRDGNTNHVVGIQCKLKGDGAKLTEKEVREEIEKALQFVPKLREYFIITTAPDDEKLQQLARQITAEHKNAGHHIGEFHIWGWGILEDHITQHAEARKAFDPSYNPHSEKILRSAQNIEAFQREEQALSQQNHDLTHANQAHIQLDVKQILEGIQLLKSRQEAPGDTTAVKNALEAHLDGEIDQYREQAATGKPKAALEMFEKMLHRVVAAGNASGRILFRIKANIGSCLYAMGEDARAANFLAEGYDHAPNEPKAIANKAFSFLLQGHWQELLTFGKAEITKDPGNEELAGYLVQAARFDHTITDPLDLISDGLKNTAAVAIGRVDFLRRRASLAEWKAAAESSLASHPLNAHAIQFAAEADIDAILTSKDFQRTHLLTAEECQRLEAAVKALLLLWDKVRNSDAGIRPDDAAICGNCIVALYALKQFPRAMEVAQQGLAVAPDDTYILSRAVHVAVEIDDLPRAKEWLAQLPSNSETVFLNFKVNAALPDWKTFIQLYETQRHHVHDLELPLITAMAKLAQLKLAGNTVKIEDIRAIAAEAKNHARASIIVADFARDQGINDIADAAFQNALSLITAASHIAGRIMVAISAARRGYWAIVADLLEGYTAEDRDSHELRTLARALANDIPIRQRALDFFARLPEHIHNLPFFLSLYGSVHFNCGTLDDAEKLFRHAAEHEADLYNYLCLCSILHRTHREEEIKALLNTIDLETAQGSPEQKMAIAQELRLAGKEEKALAFGYKILQQNKNNPQVVIYYMGLMLAPRDAAFPMPDSVNTDCWVRLEDNHGKSHAFLIEEGHDRPSEGIVSPSYSMAKKALGLKVGESFSMPASFGMEHVWRVFEIKHKYLHVLHDLIENYENRFPDAGGFASIRIKGEDIQPMLDQVRRASESIHKCAGLYLEKHIPLSMIASQCSESTISFAEYIRYLGLELQTCGGFINERKAAFSNIHQNRAQAAVLDTYTAWTAATMDALDVLKAVFGTLIIAQSTLDELQEFISKYKPDQSPEMTLGWYNGLYIKQEHTPESNASRHAYITAQIQRIKDFCTIKPAIAPDKRSEISIRFTEMFGAHIFDTAHLAAKGHLLISEDQYYRQIVDDFFSIKGLWLQSIFEYARQNGIIDTARYVQLLVQLGGRRHGFLSVRAEDLFEALKADQTQNLIAFQAIITFVCTKNADVKSAMNVVTRFLNFIWSGKTAFDLKRQKATGLLLEQITRNRPENAARALAFIKYGAKADLCTYIDTWVRGHFLCAQDFAAAETEVEEWIFAAFFKKRIL